MDVHCISNIALEHKLYDADLAGQVYTNNP